MIKQSVQRIQKIQRVQRVHRVQKAQMVQMVQMVQMAQRVERTGVARERPWFRGGLTFKAHRLMYHSILGLRAIEKKKKG